MGWRRLGVRRATPWLDSFERTVQPAARNDVLGAIDLDEGKVDGLFSGSTQTVEHLVAAINALVFERHELRATGADTVALEGNRREIVRRQSELSVALVEQYLGSPRTASPTGA